MATYEVKTPAGHVYHVDGPEGASMDQVRAEVLRQFPDAEKATAGTEWQRTQAPAPAPTPAPPQSRDTLSDIGASVMNAGAGVAQGIASIPDALFQAANGVQRVANAGVDAAGTAALRGLGMDGAADWFHRGAQGVEHDIAQRPALSDLIEKASPTPEWGGTERFLGQMAGGAMVPMGPKAPNLASIPGKTPTSVMAAADRQGITMLPADVGGTGTRMAAGVTAKTLGGIPMAEAADKALVTAANARDRVAASIGPIADETGAGQAAQKGVKSFVQKTLDRAGQLYDRISVPAKASAVTDNTRAALEELTTGFKSNPELSAIWTGNPRLKATLEALTPTDTRAEGAVKFAAAKDQLGVAERAAAEARDRASTDLRFEQTQAETAAQAAQQNFDDLSRAAQQDLSEAQSVRERLIQQVPNSGQQRALATANGAIKDAQARVTALAARDTSNPVARDAIKQLDDANAELTNLRFKEPQSEELTAAQEAVSAAQSAHDDAFVMAKQPPMGGNLSWEDMKRLRSIVGEIVGDPSLSSDGAAKSAMRKFYGALSTDMETTAAQAGPRALTEFRRATQYYRGREDRIDNVLSGILGSDLQKGASSAFEQINSWAQAKGGDFNRLARAFRSMPDDEASTVRASLLARMGQAKPGLQNADNLAFSPAEFATQWSKLSGRAKSVLFPDGQHRADINDLALVMNNMKRAGQYSNFSNTSLGSNAVAHIMGMFSAPLLTPAIAGGEFGLGKLLASPKFARWLAGAPKQASPSAMRAYAQKLPSIATANPMISDDVMRLFSAMNDNVPASASARQNDKQGNSQQPVPQP